MEQRAPKISHCASRKREEGCCCWHFDQKAMSESCLYCQESNWVPSGGTGELSNQPFSMPSSTAQKQHWPGPHIQQGKQLPPKVKQISPDFPHMRLFPERKSAKRQELPRIGRGDGILGPCGESWFLALPTLKDSRGIKCMRKGCLPSHLPPPCIYLGERMSPLEPKGVVLVPAGPPLRTHTETTLSPAHPASFGHSFSTHIKLAWVSIENTRKGYASKESRAPLLWAFPPSSLSPQLGLASSWRSSRQAYFPQGCHRPIF